VKVIPQQAEVAQGVPGKLRPRIFLTFGTTKIVGRQPYAPAAFTSGEIPVTHFQGLSRLQGTWFRWGNQGKYPQWNHRKSTVRLVAQCLNHYATPGTQFVKYLCAINISSNIRTLWYTVYGTYQLIHISARRSHPQIHYNKSIHANLSNCYYISTIK
jgi:hypothetical protein